MQPEPPLPKGCAATAYRRSKSNRACSGGHVRPWPELLRTVQLRQHFLFVSSNFLFVSSGGKAQGGFVSCIFLTRCGFCPPRVRYLKKSQFSYPPHRHARANPTECMRGKHACGASRGLTSVTIRQTPTEPTSTPQPPPQHQATQLQHG